MRVSTIMIALAPLLTQAAHADEYAAGLARQLSNPFAQLILAPLQFNYDRGIGPLEDGRRFFVNIQPVVPFSIDDDWNLISRTILPVIYQEDVLPFPGFESQFGLGDTVQSLFLSPKQPGPSGIIWGAGPVFLIPTGSERLLSTEKWGAGPTAAALIQQGGWTIGMLVNQIWSFAGEADRADVNQAFIQPFVSFTTPEAWTFQLNTESTYRWNDHEWSVPINFSVSKLIIVERRPISIGVGVRYWADSPEDIGPEGWGARYSAAAGSVSIGRGATAGVEGCVARLCARKRSTSRSFFE